MEVDLLGHELRKANMVQADLRLKVDNLTWR